MGIVSNLARPEANITGLSLLSLAHIGKQLQLLKEAVPYVRPHFALLWNSTTLGMSLVLTATLVGGQDMGLDFQPPWRYEALMTLQSFPAPPSSRDALVLSSLLLIP